MIGILEDIPYLGICVYFRWRCSTIFFKHVKVLIAVLKAVDSQSVKGPIVRGAVGRLSPSAYASTSPSMTPIQCLVLIHT